MPGADVSLLRAGRIEDAKKKVEDALTARNTAQAEVGAATQALAAATAAALPVAANVTAAETELQRARVSLDAAQGILQFEEQQLDGLLSQFTGFKGLVGHLLNRADIRGCAQYLIFGSLAAFALTMLLIGFTNASLLPNLAEIPMARGLITFLIAVVTVTIALILILAAIISDSPDREKRFVQGKEVLSVLIGVLGTIVGFYFGSSLDGAKGLDIAPVSIADASPKPGEKTELATFVSGGKAPYSYEVTFSEKSLETKKGQTLDGWIKVEVTAPAVMANDTDVSFVITVTDRNGRTGASKSSDSGKKLRLLKAGGGEKVVK